MSPRCQGKGSGECKAQRSKDSADRCCFHEALDVFGSLGITKATLRYIYLEQLPSQLSSLKEVAYETFRPLADELMQQHYCELEAVGKFDGRKANIHQRLPNTLCEFEQLCDRSGQTDPSDLLIGYEEGGSNSKHRDIYGEVSFPLQMVLLLSRPEEDFSEGKFFTIVDGQEHTADMKCGDLF
mmetsp:Transcript_424/g.561  ORF Transcript_424/g.561 Transcript_424/m.561 type:complete len:183 (+) Transcript_424:110-658(+)